MFYSQRLLNQVLSPFAERCWGTKTFSMFKMGYEIFSNGVRLFSALVPRIKNDRSLKVLLVTFFNYYSLNVTSNVRHSPVVFVVFLNSVQHLGNRLQFSAMYCHTVVKIFSFKWLGATAVVVATEKSPCLKCIVCKPEGLVTYSMRRVCHFLGTFL